MAPYAVCFLGLVGCAAALPALPLKEISSNGTASRDRDVLPTQGETKPVQGAGAPRRAGNGEL